MIRILPILLILTACAQTRPPIEAISGFYPDCQNRDRQIRYLTELKRHPTGHSEDRYRYDQTVDIQIERLKGYCQ
jgi:hypothetical protein